MRGLSNGEPGGHAMGRPRDNTAHESARIDRRALPHHLESEIETRRHFLFKAEERQRVAHCSGWVAHARPNFEGRAAVTISNVKAGPVDKQEQRDLCVSAQRRLVQRSAKTAATGVGSRLGVCKCGPGSHRDLVHSRNDAPGVVEPRCYVQDCVSEAVGGSDLGDAGIAEFASAHKRVRRGTARKQSPAALAKPSIPMPQHCPKLCGTSRHNSR